MQTLFCKLLSDNYCIEIRNVDTVLNKCKRLRPGKISSKRCVADHIPRPPYVKSKKPPGIASGPEVHDEKGIECMRASGRLAAQVLESAGTLVKDGDIVNTDVTVYLNVTKECLDKAISVCAPGLEYKKIGNTIQNHADKNRYGVVRQLVDHGVGRVFHADPVILHFSNHSELSAALEAKPMLTMGSYNAVMWDDNWTVVTEDGSLSVQFEHTIIKTENGAEILTRF
ncbi:hypothetical protein DVH24_030042 [Malus domestica]|uniref:Peptidase M24 domain-containing protein n=1 Tax=Malus domestica TaxID=3750 RepID=A0A498I1L7_MALDO|nr:hypothetical protein DVH24_030042 [Malus domestica]